VICTLASVRLLFPCCLTELVVSVCVFHWNKTIPAKLSYLPLKRQQQSRRIPNTNGRHIEILLAVLDFDLHLVIGMSFWICFTNLVATGQSAAELWRHLDVSRWRQSSWKSTFVFRFSGGTCLRKWKSICIPNCDEIAIYSHKTTSGFGKRTSVIFEFYTVSQKNIPDVFSYNSRKHWRIFIIFGRNVTEKASNHMLLHFPTSPN